MKIVNFLLITFLEHSFCPNPIKQGGGRGRNRIRTGVDGFADHCLATRPSDLNKKCKHNKKLANKNIIPIYWDELFLFYILPN